MSYSLRNCRGMEDCKHIADIYGRCRVTDGLESVWTLEEVENSFQHLTNCDPEKDMVIVEKEGEPVAYSMMWWFDCEEGRMYPLLINVVPEARDQGITERLVEWAKDHVSEMGHDNDKKTIQIVLEPGEGYISEASEKMGFTYYRYGLTMLRPNLEDIPEYPLPDGVEVRPVKPEEHESIRLAWNEACKDLRAQQPLSKENLEGWRKEPDFDDSLWTIAWYGDEVVGTCFGMISTKDNQVYERKRGMTELISSRKDWRGKGLAKALISMTLQKLKDRGMEEAALGVDPDNPSGARHLYEKLGFQEVSRVSFYRYRV